MKYFIEKFDAKKNVPIIRFGIELKFKKLFESFPIKNRSN